MAETDGHVVLQHFILTRFNIRIWSADKTGTPVRTDGWQEQRFSLFEKYCLPSVLKQTCRDFEWIVLFDSETPAACRKRIAEYQRLCPRLIPVFVEPEIAARFPRVFRAEVSRRVHAGRVLTTYLDNDDALNLRFVEDLQRRADALDDGTFICYDDGFQLYTDHDYLMRIHYPRNHFVSFVEGAASFRTIFGYGSHYFLEEIEGVRIEHAGGRPMWCEVIHDRNMCNDAYYLFKARMDPDGDVLQREFGLAVDVKSGPGLYLFRFLPRFARTCLRRARHYFLGRKW